LAPKYGITCRGVATILDTNGDTAQVLARNDLAGGAHSGTVDPATHTLYVPVADLSGKPVLRVLTPDR
jgi:hypothetical protein